MATAVTPLHSVPHAEIREVFEKQRATALRLRTSTASERVAKLKKLRDAILARMDIWYQAAWADYRKPKIDCDIAELLPIATEVNDAISHLEQWMKPQRVAGTLVTAGTTGTIRYEPRGRCLIISPWNYALNLTFTPLISAIAAGNTAIIKPSELTPHQSAAMAKMLSEVFTPDEVAVFEGDAAVSQALLELPFDHIFFTGSPAIGKVVMAAAAKHLTSVTLELGGKSPSIVDESADVSLAAQNVLWGKCLNAGQTCIAPDHVFVHARVKDRFLEQCRHVLAKSPDWKQATFARIVNARHTTRIKALLDEAVSRGAKVLAGGAVAEAENFIAPTLLENIPPDAKIMSEEIFGPLLPVFTFDDLGKVIAQINAEPKPLALYIYSKSDEVAQRIISQTSSGSVCVNHALLQYVHTQLPFGGVNNSGIGNAHGFFGFKAFSHERSILKAQLGAVPKLFAPGDNPLLRNLLAKAWKLV